MGEIWLEVTWWVPLGDLEAVRDADMREAVRGDLPVGGRCVYGRVLNAQPRHSRATLGAHALQLHILVERLGTRVLQMHVRVERLGAYAHLISQGKESVKANLLNDTLLHGF